VLGHLSPQEVLENGAYTRFRAANVHALEQCEKDATIRSLREQLKRTRDIDAQIDQKERELLH